MMAKFVASNMLVLLIANSCLAQQKKAEEVIPTATQWTLDAAGPSQRSAIGSVYMMYCPIARAKGTGFLLKNGLVVTNAHVVAGCSAEQMIARPSIGPDVRFSKMATDQTVDLALLRPTIALSGGLDLGSDRDPTVGTAVSTWGYPLMYNGPAPLLSVGYVAGFNSEDAPGGRHVKHLVVNGAFNPGNSGGPLFQSKSNKVIGVVVAKFHLYPPSVKQAIDVMANNKNGLQYTGTDENGNTSMISEAQVVASVLEQFYRTTQVMIGEAISLSELKTFLAEKEQELR
jgi:hypothetical protein